MLFNHLEAEYHRIDLWYFISFITGIYFYFSISSEPHFKLLGFILSLLLIFLFFAYQNLVLRFFILILISFSAGMIVSQYRILNLTIFKLEKPIITKIQGQVNSIKPVAKGVQVVVHVKKVEKERRLNDTKIRLNVAEKFLSGIRVGDEILLTAKLFNLSGSILPGSYNFGFYLYLDGITASGYVLNKLHIISSIPKSSSNMEDLRQKIYQRLVSKGGKTIGNFIAALLLGEAKALEADLLQNMRIAGISHILCVSGLHLSLVAMLVFASSRFLLNLSNFISYKFDVKMIAAIICLIASYIYLQLSGVQIAATRAFVMTAAFIISISLGRKTYLLRALGIAAVIIIIPRPEYIFYPAFELSFIAVLSLISGFEFYKNNKRIFGEAYGILGQIKFYIISNIYSSFLASIITAPIVINQFYIFSTYSVLNNLIAVPIMSFFLMPLCIITALIMPLGFDGFFIKSLGFFINILIKFVYYSNSLPHAVWYFGNITTTSLFIFLFGFFWVCIWQTQIRCLGIIIILFSFSLMMNTSQPDFIFDFGLKSLGVQDRDNKLEIYTNHMSNFTSNYWANWYGQKVAHTLPIDRNSFISAGGKSLSINYRGTKCLPADIQLNIDKVCPAKYLELSKDFLEKQRVIAIYCEKNKCKVRRNKNRWL